MTVQSAPEGGSNEDGGDDATSPNDTDGSTVDGGGQGDGDANTPLPPPCDSEAPFGAPTLVPGVDTAEDESTPALTANELEIYFTRGPVGTFLELGIYHARRTSIGGTFTDVEKFLDRPGQLDADPFISYDGKTVFATLTAGPGALGKGDIYRIEGATQKLIGGANSAAEEGQPFLTADGNDIWFMRIVATQRDIITAAYNAASNSISIEKANETLNDPAADDEWPVLSTDKLTIYFASKRTLPGVSGQKIWMAKRESPTGDFTNPTPVDELNDLTASDAPRWLSPDGCRIYLRSDRAGGIAKSLWVAQRPPKQ